MPAWFSGAMIHARRRLEFPQFDARIVCERLVGPSFQLKVWDVQGVTIEEAMHDPSWRAMVDGWPTLVVAFRGGGCVRTPWRTAWMRENSFTADPPTGGIGRGFIGRIHEGTSVVLLQWDPSVWGAPRIAPDALQMAERDTNRLRDLAQSAVGAPAELRGAAVARLADALRAWGLPFDRDLDLGRDDRPAPGDQRLVDAAYRALSELGSNPTAKDFAAWLGVSEGHAHRLLARIPDRIGRAVGWRELKRVIRVSTGLALMTSPRATTEAVGAALGYSSPTAFCRAMAQAGLPSPGAIRGRVADLA